MKKLWIFILILVLVNINVFAQQQTTVNPVQTPTYTQTEIDLKLQLQQKEVENLHNEISAQEKRIDAQDKYVESRHKWFDTWISNLTLIATLFGIGITIGVFVFGYFISQRTKRSKQEVRDELKNVKDLKIEIEKIKEESEINFKKITKNTEESNKLLYQQAKNVPREEQTEKIKEEIAEKAEKNIKTISSNNWFLMGYDAAENKKYNEAIVYFSNAIKLNPDDEIAYNNRGGAYFILEQYEKAIVDYNKTIELNPDFAEAYNNRGVTYMRLQQYEQAIADFNKTIELNPNYVNTYYNMACLYSLQNKKDKAFEYLEKSFEKKFNRRRELIETDTDFENIKTDKRFKELLDKYF